MTQSVAPSPLIPPASVPRTRRLGRSIRWIARILVTIIGCLILVGIIVWSSLAVCFADLAGSAPRQISAVIVAIVMLAALLFVRTNPRAWRGRLLRPHPLGLAVFAAIFLVIVIWFQGR